MNTYTKLWVIRVANPATVSEGATVDVDLASGKTKRVVLGPLVPGTLDLFLVAYAGRAG